MMTSARGLFHSILRTVHLISLIMKSKLYYVSKCNYFLHTAMHIPSTIGFIKLLYFIIFVLFNFLTDFFHYTFFF